VLSPNVRNPIYGMRARRHGLGGPRAYIRVYTSHMYIDLLSANISLVCMNVRTCTYYTRVLYCTNVHV